MKKTVCLLLAVLCFAMSLPSFMISAADGEIPYYKADQATIDKYLKTAYDMRDKIISSKTDVSFTGTAYYVSPNGDDSNNGLTPATAFKSVEKVSNASWLKPGDAVLFERGATFRTTGMLHAKTGVTYSAYGNGAKPKIIGSINASRPDLWLETEYKNVYKYINPIDQSKKDVGQIIFDLGRAWGVKLASGVGPGTTSNGLEIINCGSPRMDSPKKLKNDLEYWHNPDDNYLYLYSKDGNPATRFASIEIVDKGNGIAGEGHSVVFNDLTIFGFGSHGIGFSNSSNVTVQNCVFEFIGGSLQTPTVRFGNAVEVFGSIDGFIIRDCFAHNVYDCCWTIQWQGEDPGEGKYFKNIQFYNNVSCYSNTGLEMWLNNKGPNPEIPMVIENVEMYNNYTYYNGYGWSQQRPNKGANNFFGDLSETTTTYKNVSIHNNVGLFPSIQVTKARNTGTQAYNFNNNVYFQHNNKLFGGVAENPETGKGSIGNFVYDRETMTKLLATGFEPGSVFYYVDANYEIPQYKPEHMSFDDITEKHWAYEYVKTAVLRSYFNGTSTTTFSPDTTMTRAMLVTVLSRIAEADISKSKPAPFTDVNRNSWYVGAVDWAHESGIVAENVTKFRPDDAATREELADMLYRFTLNAHRTSAITNPSFTFKDASSVSAEYASGIAFATQNGIISGYTDGSVKPKNTATRAEVATMIKRFVDLYYTLEINYTDLSEKTDSHVFSGNELSAIMATSSCDKRVVKSDNNEDIVRILPSSAIAGEIKVNIFERFTKVSISDYPFIKIRYNVDLKSPNVKVTLTKNGQSEHITIPNTQLGWKTAVICVYDLIAPGAAYDGELNATLSFTPWTEEAPAYGVDFAEIDYIGFFPTEEAANAYKSDLEQKSATVKFMVNGKLFSEELILRGNKLVYPEAKPSVPGSLFTGWSVPEGTVIDSDITVDAVLDKNAGVPFAVYNGNEIVLEQVHSIFKTEISEDKGSKYLHIEAVDSGTANDGTRVYMVLPSVDYDIKEAHYLKIAYRTNIKSSPYLDLNFKPDAGLRVWGPKISYNERNKWVEAIVDLSKANFTGGEGVTAGLKPGDYFEQYFSGNLYGFVFKPYSASANIQVGDYIDVKYFAVFDSFTSAAKYSPEATPEVKTSASDKTESNTSSKAPAALYNAKDITIEKISDTLSYELSEDKGEEFMHVSVKTAGTAVDGTRVYLTLPPALYDASESRFMKFVYRTNITSNSNLDLNFRPVSNIRLWGVRIPYTDKNKWVETVVDLSKLNYTGGEGVAAGLKPEEYFAEYVYGSLYGFILKPYWEGASMKETHYFDIKYIAFFDSMTAAKAYKQ